MRIEDLEEIAIPEEPKAMMSVSLEAKQILKENQHLPYSFYCLLPILVLIFLSTWYYLRSLILSANWTRIDE